MAKACALDSGLPKICPSTPKLVSAAITIASGNSCKTALALAHAKRSTYVATSSPAKIDHHIWTVNFEFQSEAGARSLRRRGELEARIKCAIFEEIIYTGQSKILLSKGCQ